MISIQFLYQCFLFSAIAARGASFVALPWTTRLASSSNVGGGSRAIIRQVPTTESKKYSQLRASRSGSTSSIRNSNRSKRRSKWKEGGGGGGGFGAKATTSSPKKTSTKSGGASRSPPSPRQSQQQQQQQPNRATNNFGTVPQKHHSAAALARINTFQTQQDEIEKLQELYRQQDAALRRLDNNEHANRRQLVQVSTDPLIFVMDEFIDPDLCRQVQNDATGCFQLMYPELLADRLFNGQECEMDGLLFNTESSADHQQEHKRHLPYYPNGLHMDTNNQCLFRHVTCILYLNDVPSECGGATVFPLARALPGDELSRAAQQLLHHQISHTQSREIVDLQLAEQALLLEQVSPSTALGIQPKAGRLLVFFRATPTAGRIRGRGMPGNEFMLLLMVASRKSAS